MLRAVAVSVSVSVAVAVSAPSAARAADFPVEDRTLPNGVRVVASWTPVVSTGSAAGHTVVVETWGGKCRPCGGIESDDLEVALARYSADLDGAERPVLVVVAGAFDPDRARALVDDRIGSLILRQPASAARSAAPEIERVRHAREKEKVAFAVEYRVAQPTLASACALAAGGTAVLERLRKRFPAIAHLEAEPRVAILTIILDDALPATPAPGRVLSSPRALPPWELRAALDDELAALRDADVHAAAPRARALFLNDGDALFFATLALGNPRLARDFDGCVAGVTAAAVRGELARRRRVLYESRPRLPMQQATPRVP
jgi:hypothetical protein